MKKFNITITTIKPYLQARFGKSAQKSLKVKAGNKAKIEDDKSWQDLIYQDDKGIYIPQTHIRESLVNGGKSIKKKPYGSFKEIVQSYFSIEPEKIYIGKQKPDYVNESFPSRADGQRVRLLHPAFKEGLKIEFVLAISSDDMDNTTIKAILEKAGYEKGIGAWRAGGNGRYEITKFEEI